MKIKPVTVAGAPAKEALASLVSRPVSRTVVLRPSMKYLTQRLGMSPAAALKLLGG